MISSQEADRLDAMVSLGLTWRDGIKVNQRPIVISVKLHSVMQVGPGAVMTGCKAKASELEAEAKKLNANTKIAQAVLREVKRYSSASFMLDFIVILTSCLSSHTHRFWKR